MIYSLYLSRGNFLFPLHAREKSVSYAQHARALHTLRRLLTASEDHVESALNLRQLPLEFNLVLNLSSQAGEERVD
jgi:hypothetical protein